MNIRQLIYGAKSGSSAAQKCLYDLYADRLMMVCRRYVKGSEDAEEVMLDGFYKFYKNLSSFQYQNDAAVYVWLKRIMINECLMFLRKKTVFTIVAETVVEDVPFEQCA